MADHPTIYVVDDDMDLASSLSRLLQRSGFISTPYSDPAALLEQCREAAPHCVVTDVMMAELDGFMLAERLRDVAPTTAIIFMTAWPKTAAAVDAVRTFGGIDYLEKPIDEVRLLNALNEAVAWSERRRLALSRLNELTPREWDVFRLLTQGLSNKMIAAELGLHPKTIEDHRASIMRKTQANGLSQLIELDRVL